MQKYRSIIHSCVKYSEYVSVAAPFRKSDSTPPSRHALFSRLRIYNVVIQIDQTKGMPLLLGCVWLAYLHLGLDHQLFVETATLQWKEAKQ